ncbi:hypothetical protein [Microbispora sp. H10836]|uniref:hypothetical protein n=1 Tax=Microbispora sp. H10836 TaxID=2729106 RepID=UPI0014730A64|nr:hypothetical protein [Microbispora sp. H10836]
MPPAESYSRDALPYGAAVSELVQLFVRGRDSFLLRSEIDDHSNPILYIHDHTETVPIMGDLVVHTELLDRWGRRRGLEGTCGQVTAGRAAGWFHSIQYVLLAEMVTTNLWSRADDVVIAAVRLGGPGGDARTSVGMRSLLTLARTVDGTERSAVRHGRHLSW